MRAWHEGWWEIGRETGDLLAPILGVRAGHDHHAPERHRRAVDRRRPAVSFDGARRKIVLQDLDFPTNHYLFEGFRRYGAEIVYVPSDDAIRAPIDRLVDAIDERTALVPMSLVLFRSALPAGRAAGRRAAHRVGARVILDVYQGAGTVPMDLAATGRRLRRRRLGEVALRRAGRGLPVRPAGPGARAAAVDRRAGPGTPTPFGFETGAIRYADGIERFQSGTPNVPALYSARAGYEIVAEIGVRGDSRALAAADAAADGRGRARAAGGSTRRPPTTSAAARSSSTCPTAPRVTDELLRAQGDRRLPAERRHPPRAALLQHRGGNRSRRRGDGRDRDRSGGAAMSVRTVADARRRHDGPRHRPRGGGRRAIETRLYDVSETQLAKARDQIDGGLQEGRRARQGRRRPTPTRASRG